MGGERVDDSLCLIIRLCVEKGRDERSKVLVEVFDGYSFLRSICDTHVNSIDVLRLWHALFRALVVDVDQCVSHDSVGRVGVSG